ncbi:FG-GAP-like repeat-containing protein [Leifsonia sp. NPDC080035]|uniref:lysozyme n=1 Tax=Leifsonia sp. NPDC080035 TaxID=3143936 RepID=A0AAU7G9S8_9MICO
MPRRIPRALLPLLVGALATGLTVTGAAPALATSGPGSAGEPATTQGSAATATPESGAPEPTAPTPEPTPSATGTPSPSASPAPAPTTSPAPSASSQVEIAEDPSLATQNAARNHAMGSTIAANDPNSSAKSARGLSSFAGGLPPGVPGLDVSGWQVLTAANWRTIAANGAKFVYVKATESTDYKSSQFAEQYNDSYAAGLIHGAYHFATPNTSSGATQANYFVNNGGGWSADGRTLPPLLDIEYNPYGATCYGLSAAEMVSWIRDFSNTILARTGRLPAIYSTTDWWTRCTGNNPGFGANPLFIARYPSNISSGAGTLPAGWSNYSIWQYASSGIFPGDQDTFNGTLANLQQFASNGPIVEPMAAPVIGVGDFNGDGKPDLIGRRSNGALLFYAGTGSVTGMSTGYQSAQQIGTGWGVYDALVGTGDLNGDGKPDLLARRTNGTLWFYAGTGRVGGGSEGYAAAVQVGSGYDQYSQLVGAGDFTGDGKADVLGVKPDGTLWLLPGTGRAVANGIFGTPTQIGSSWNTWKVLLGVGDLDRDGKPDLVGIRADGTAGFYSGTWSAPYYKVAVPITIPGVSSTDVFAAPGDFDGDGIPDLLDRTVSGELRFIGGGQIAEGYAAGRVLSQNWASTSQVIPAGDIDGDGKPDVLTTGTDGSLYLHPGTRTSTVFGASVKIGSNWTVYSRVVATGDFNGDKKPDFLGIRPDGTLWFYAGTGKVGSGDEGYAKAVQIGHGWNVYSSIVGVGDLNGDGKNDLVAVRPDGVAMFYAGTGIADATHEGYKPAVQLGTGWNGGADLIGPKDFSGDGKADLITRTPDGTVTLKLGTGTVNGAKTFSRNALIGRGWSIFSSVAGVGDLDGDGKNDLVAVRPDGTVYFYSGTGDAGAVTTGYAKAAVAIGRGWDIFR